jgi:DNA-binding CsgD family transcriptional regulator
VFESRAARLDTRAPKGTPSRRAGRADEVSVVEAAYSLDGTESDWLGGIASAAAPVLDEGWGVAAATVVAQQGGFQIRAIAAVGGPPGFAEAVAMSNHSSRAEIRAGIFRSAPCTSLSLSGGSRWIEEDPGSQLLLALGIRDVIATVGVDSGRYGIVLQAYRANPTWPSRRLVSRWSRVASHLAAGFRIRRGLAAAQISAGARPDPLSGSEAIFTPTGRLEHAGDQAQVARKSLARAVLAVGRSRGPLRNDDPDAALDAWKGLVAGRWSLVDHVDSDGKRFLVARKNDPEADGPAGLSLRERQVLADRARGLALKLIAYDLGLSVPTVSKSLQTGMAKLGLSSEADLVGLSRG